MVSCFYFRDIFTKIKDETFDYNGQYLVVLTEIIDNQHEIIHKILQDFWSLEITNVDVLARLNGDTRVILYTYFPYTRFHCGMVDPVVINYYVNNTFIWKTDIFPNKLQNFHRCPLTLATYQLDPFMLLTPNNNTGYSTSGLDGIVFRVLSQRLNFTPIVRKVAIDDLAGCRNCDECDCKSKSISAGALKLVFCLEF